MPCSKGYEISRSLHALGVYSFHQEGLAYLDTNGDGSIERKEIFAAVKEFKRLFMAGVKTLETMGPMLEMFSAFQPPDARGGGARGAGRKRSPKVANPTRDEL